MARRGQARERRSLRERLRSEVWRHGTAGVVLVTGYTTGSVIAAQSARAGDWDGSNTALVTSILISFGLYGPVYFALSKIAYHGLSGQEFRDSLERSTPPKSTLLRWFLIGTPTTWAMLAAMFALFAVGALALTDRFAGGGIVVVASLVAVVGSWVLVLASSTVEYARAWADSDAFVFPGGDEEQRSFSDFVYLAVQTATTYSSSDVSSVSGRARRLVTINGLAGFVFSTVVLALLIALVLNAL